MSSIHDYNIYQVEIKCGIGEILFYTNIVNEEQPKEKVVKFIGVIGHMFLHILEGNIIFDITKESPVKFFNNLKYDLQEYHKYGLRLNCSNQEDFSNSLALNEVSIYCINASYGLSGWVIAKEIEISEK